MREIKFRVWDKPRKIMYYISDMYWFEETGINEMKDDEWYAFMQFTGLKDKNGREIYEGDIIRNEWKNAIGEDIGNSWVVKFGTHQTSTDYYATDAYGWYAEAKSGEQHTIHNLPTSRDSGVIILGNTHDNPELLGGGAEKSFSID